MFTIVSEFYEYYKALAKKPFVGIKFPPMPVTKDRNYLSNSEALTIKLPPWSE